MMAYTGRYRIDEDRFITKIDSSWNEAWNGSPLCQTDVRHLSL